MRPRILQAICLTNTQLKKESVELNGYTMMNAEYAKVIFSTNMISFQMSYLNAELGLNIDLKSMLEFDSQLAKLDHVAK